jgi:hypothetical protein
MLNLMRSRSRHMALAGLAAVLALGVVAAAPQPAEARFVLGIGIGMPVYPPYYPPPYYYAPPPVVYAPPPVYAPPVVMPAPAAPAMVATPTSQPYTAPNGQTCREYQSTAIINGVNQQTTGTACLQPDGSWRIVN